VNRATRSVEMGFCVSGDRIFSAAPLRQRLHQVEQSSGGCSRFRFWQHGAELRDNLVVNRNLHTGTRISPDLTDQCRQPFTRFADREFHHGLRSNTLNVQPCTSLVNLLVAWDVAGSCFSRTQEGNCSCQNNPFNPVNQYHPDNPLNPANKYNPDVPFAPLDEREWDAEDTLMNHARQLVPQDDFPTRTAYSSAPVMVIWTGA